MLDFRKTQRLQERTMSAVVDLAIKTF